MLDLTMKLTLTAAAIILSCGAIFMATTGQALNTGATQAAKVVNPQGVASASSSSFSGQAVDVNPSAPKVVMTTADFIKDAIAKHDVVVFSKSYCPYCRATKTLLSEINAGAHVIELDQREDGGAIQAELATLTGQRTVPNVFVKGNHVGGNDATQAAHRSGALKALMDGPRK